MGDSILRLLPSLSNSPGLYPWSGCWFMRYTYTGRLVISEIAIISGLSPVSGSDPFIGFIRLRYSWRLSSGMWAEYVSQLLVIWEVHVRRMARCSRGEPVIAVARHRKRLWESSGWCVTLLPCEVIIREYFSSCSVICCM